MLNEKGKGRSPCNSFLARNKKLGKEHKMNFIREDWGGGSREKRLKRIKQEKEINYKFTFVNDLSIYFKEI